MSFLSGRIGWRYVRARRSRSAVKGISVTAVVGVAVATAAIVCVLSVFNGFRAVLAEKLDILAPDVLVSPTSGKVFSDGDSVAAIVRSVPGVGTATATITDNALAIASSHEMPVTLRGVDPAVYRRVTRADSILLEGGEWLEADAGEAVIAIGTASQLGVYGPDAQMLLFAPRRIGRVNLSNPVASFITDSVTVSAIYQAGQSEYDQNTVICEINTARDLFQYDAEASAVEVAAAPGVSPSQLAARISERLGEGAVVKDRVRQQEMNFRMIEIEKWVTFLLLFFILIIASFNIISTMSMAVLEKQKSMSALRALGMSRRRIGWIFWWQSIYVSLAGGISGILLGLALCLAQQHFGLLKLSGDPDAMIVKSYPVVVEWSDMLIALLPVLVIGLITASVTARYARRRLTER